MIRTLSASTTTLRPLWPLLGAAIAALALSGCGDTRRAMGLDRTSPDEFAVVSRAPLTLPPSLTNANLPKPRPGAPRPQEPNPTQVAAATVFGKAAQSGTAAAAGATSGERALIAQASGFGIEPNIRAKVDQETTSLIIADRRWIDTLLFWQKHEAPYSVVDPEKEAQRLRQAESQGQPLNTGVVPTIERTRKAPLEGLF